jgi:small-conductance mechanosensitive channel
MLRRSLITRGRAVALPVLIAVSVVLPFARAGASGVEPADLVFANRKIATLRATVLGWTPEQRVQAALSRMETAVVTTGSRTVTFQTLPEGTLLLIKSQGIFVITPADLDSLAGETMDHARAAAITNLSMALRDDAELHNPRRLRWGVIRVLISGLLFAAIVVILFRVINRFEPWMRATAARQAQKLSGKMYMEQTLRASTVAAHVLVRLLFWGSLILVTQFWVTFSLKQFPYTRPWGENMGGFLLHAFRDMALAVVHAIPGLFFVAMIFLATRLLSRWITSFFRAVEQGRVVLPGFHADTALPTRRIVVTLIWLGAVAVAYPFIPGSRTDAFKGVSVLVGLMVSLGSSGTVNQIASGLMLMYSRALRVGDYVQIGEIEGVVTSMNILSVKIRTIKRIEVSIPNAVVISTNTRNFSRLGGAEGILVYTSVTIGYGTPWRQVHELLKMAAGRVEGIKKDPPPFVFQTNLSDFYVEYQINGHLENPETRLRVIAELHRNIQDTFNEYGVQILSPHYENDPTVSPTVVPKSKWYEAPARAPGQEERATER